MCRMAILIGDQGSLERAKGSMIDSLVRAARKDPHGQALFGGSELSHRDGWGWALIYMHGDKVIENIGRSTMPIYEDPSIDVLKATRLPPGGKSILMIHARAASRDMPVNIFSTHPAEAMTNKGYRLILIHNGTVDKNKLLEILGIGRDTYVAKIYNDTYFLARYMAEMISEEINGEILREAAKLTKTALNIGMALIKEQEVWIAVGSLYRTPDKHVERRNYYKIYRGDTEDLVIYSSSTPIDFYKPEIDAEWKELPNGHFEIYRLGENKIEMKGRETIKI